MKKNRSVLLATMLAIVTLGCCCCNDNEQDVKKIGVIAIEPETEAVLQNAMEINFNPISMETSDSLIIIDNKDDLSLLLDNDNIDIDFSKYTLLCGWVTTASYPSIIESKELLFDNTSDTYQYFVNVNTCSAGYQAMRVIYFVSIYPKIYKNIELVVNYYSNDKAFEL